MLVSKSPPFLEGFEILKIPLFDEKGNSVWPERFSPKKCKEIAHRSGPLKFNSQMLLIVPETDNIFFDTSLINVYNKDVELFQSNGIQKYFLDGRNLTFGCVSWDPSLGKATSDKSIVVAIFKDDQSNCYINDLKCLNKEDENSSAQYQCEEVIIFMKKNNLFNLVIETNGIGAFLSEMIIQTAKTMNYPIFIKKVVQTQNKNERIIRNIQPLLYSSYFYIKANLTTSVLVEELESFKIERQNNKDDCIDAIATGLESNFGSLSRKVIINSNEKKAFYQAKTNFNI